VPNQQLYRAVELDLLATVSTAKLRPGCPDTSHLGYITVCGFELAQCPRHTGGQIMELLLLSIAAVGSYLLGSVRILRQYERAVVFLLGKYAGTVGPGVAFLPLGFTRIQRVSLRIVAMDIPAQDVITRDNISVKVNAVLYFRVADPALAVLEIQDYLYATGQLAQTTLLSVLGQVELDELLADRRKVNDLLREIIDERTDFWGVDVSAVEIKDVQLPESMRRAIARQAEAERERRAKVINAQGELQASETLAEAARVMQSQPASLQLRYLQTVTEIASENSSTTIFPIPIDMMRAFMQRLDDIATPAQTGKALPPATTPDALAAVAREIVPKIQAQAARKPKKGGSK
jgi:regulator of protease activity HflC (stomatin/prohibitin superfamily)